MQSKREICETWFKRVWSDEDESAIEAMLVPDTQARGLNDQGDATRIGPEEFKEFHRLLLGLIGNVRVEILRFLEQGDWASMVCTLTGTGHLTGQPVEMQGQLFVRIVDGKLLEADNDWDFLALFEQLELLPKGTFGRCLGGSKLP